MEQNSNNKLIKTCFEWLDIVVSSVLAVVLIFTFVFRIVSIDGDSMNDTLLNKERIIVTNVFYTPKRGDIVVISRNNESNIANENFKEPIIKSVIATEGQMVEIKDGKVFIDGILLDEPYIKNYNFNKYSTYGTEEITYPLIVEEDHIFVLGDNRTESLDSRFAEIGQINKKNVMGKAVFRILPITRFGGL